MRIQNYENLFPGKRAAQKRAGAALLAGILTCCAGAPGLRAQTREDSVAELREEVQQLRAEMKAQGEGLRKEIREGDEETRRQMRVLHEEVIDRLKRIGHG